MAGDNNMNRHKRKYSRLSSPNAFWILCGSLGLICVAIMVFLFSSITEGAPNVLPGEHNVTVRIIASSPLLFPVSNMYAGYAAASQGSMFAALVRPEAGAESMSADVAGLALVQDFFGNRVYLVFTHESARQNMLERTEMIKNNEFNKYAAPSFGFSLSDTHHVVIFKEYTGIDLVGPATIRLRPGSYNLVISSEEDSEGNTQVRLGLK